MKFMLFPLLLSLLGVIPRQDLIYIHGEPTPALPTLEFTEDEIIDVLTEYEVHHSNSLGCAQYFGATDFNQKQIDICNKYDLAARRETTIHELLHVMYRRHGLDTGGAYEYAIEAKAQEIYKKLYALPLPPPPVEPSIVETPSETDAPPSQEATTPPGP